MTYPTATVEAVRLLHQVFPWTVLGHDIIKKTLEEETWVFYPYMHRNNTPPFGIEIHCPSYQQKRITLVYNDERRNQSTPQEIFRERHTLGAVSAFIGDLLANPPREFTTVTFNLYIIPTALSTFAPSLSQLERAVLVAPSRRMKKQWIRDLQLSPNWEPKTKWEPFGDFQQVIDDGVVTDIDKIPGAALGVAKQLLQGPKGIPRTIINNIRRGET